mmetsp:Transcript_3695/g.10368  ORF Transcript_3695/g.10368 Transcript_3695/m.10368 type:complete len:202 (+) Transcript_3695:463-1068(+)
MPCQLQWRLSRKVLHVHVGTSVQQELHDISVHWRAPVCNSSVQWVLDRTALPFFVVFLIKAVVCKPLCELLRILLFLLLPSFYLSFPCCRCLFQGFSLSLFLCFLLRLLLAFLIGFQTPHPRLLLSEIRLELGPQRLLQTTVVFLFLQILCFFLFSFLNFLVEFRFRFSFPVPVLLFSSSGCLRCQVGSVFRPHNIGRHDL